MILSQEKNLVCVCADFSFLLSLKLEHKNVKYLFFLFIFDYSSMNGEKTFLVPIGICQKAQ